MVEHDLIVILKKVMGIWGLLLIVFGVIFNAIVFIVCMKSRKLRKTSTFKFIAIAAINDALSCFPWNFGDFTNIFFDFHASRRSLVFCEFLANFLVFTTCSYASWLLVTISLDRVLSLNVHNWATKYFKGKRPLFFAAILLAFIMAIYSVSAFKTGYSYVDKNGTQKTVCFHDSTGSKRIYDIMCEVRFNFS